jgi:hypothetical protein
MQRVQLDRARPRSRSFRVAMLGHAQDRVSLQERYDLQGTHHEKHDTHFELLSFHVT